MGNPRNHAVTNYLRNYVVSPRYTSRRLTLRTADGVALAAYLLPGPPEATTTFVVVHGFANWSRNPRIHAFATRLSRASHVVVPDLRGHGRSQGRCTLGRDEPLDVAAAVAAAPTPTVVTVGVSLGAAAVLVHAARNPVAGVVAVSAPAWWEAAGGTGAQRVGQWVNSATRRRLLARAVRTRVADDCTGRVDPVDAVADIGSPTLFVHDPDDHYFDGSHATALYERARPPKDLWWRPGQGHGTDLLTDELADLILRGPWPSSSPAPAPPSGTGSPTP
ncbi:MAG TPA: alpha/beta hydrolase [Acidimicrobiales bacterium]|nr:alpha/beta hydrolase [Acidimicrobiales bacterium]